MASSTGVREANRITRRKLFVKEELTGYLNKMIESQKSVYDHVIWDSDNEANFTTQLEMNAAVKVYAKLPGWFQVPTPLGSYNPDWAVLIGKDNGQLLYFVAETKGTSHLDDLRNTERAKAECGKVHFETLKIGEDPAQYRVVHTLDELFN